MATPRRRRSLRRTGELHFFIDHRLTNYKFLMYWIEVTDFDHRGRMENLLAECEEWVNRVFGTDNKDP